MPHLEHQHLNSTILDLDREPRYIRIDGELFTFHYFRFRFLFQNKHQDQSCDLHSTILDSDFITSSLNKNNSILNRKSLEFNIFMLQSQLQKFLIF